jgi:drug/metabolite transporter (DMT)-like permease
MHIDEQTKLVIGILFVIIGVVILFVSRRTRGFGQRRQAGVLLLIVGALFIAVGLGHDPRTLIGR